MVGLAQDEILDQKYQELLLLIDSSSSRPNFVGTANISEPLRVAESCRKINDLPHLHWPSSRYWVLEPYPYSLHSQERPLADPYQGYPCSVGYCVGNYSWARLALTLDASCYHSPSLVAHLAYPAGCVDIQARGPWMGSAPWAEECDAAASSPCPEKNPRYSEACHAVKYLS